MILLCLCVNLQVMATKAQIDDFVKQKKLAMVGVSRNGKKFSNYAFRELIHKGYQLYPVHPQAAELEGTTAYPTFASLPEKVGGALIMVNPERTPEVIEEAAEAGIQRIWIQQGADSEEARKLSRDKGISAVHGLCILMYAEPVTSFHKVHQVIWKLLGKVPK
jgi:predicted CoA-binding protein